MPSPQEVTFFILAVAILVSAIGVVALRNAIHSALSLIVSLLAVSALFVVMRAEFLFATQLLVYTGGVMVLFLFVIMLVDVDRAAHLRVMARYGVFFGVSIGALFALLAWQFGRSGVAPGTGEALDLGGNTRSIAGTLLTSYLLPFEIVSVLLLVAMVGAIVLSKKEI